MRLTKYRRSSWMANFSLRFVYEFFFEFFLCLLINISTAAPSDGLFYSIGLVMVLGLVAFVAILVVFFFKWGPYTVPKSYDANSLRKSWWGSRPLCPEEHSKDELCLKELNNCNHKNNNNIDVAKNNEANDEEIGHVGTPADTNRGLLRIEDAQPIEIDI